jgi:hypothetical protein
MQKRKHLCFTTQTSRELENKINKYANDGFNLKQIIPINEPITKFFCFPVNKGYLATMYKSDNNFVI